jgi:2-dehydro-3-deoxyphosphogluconate aldolase/(4S)-4-hydroxy-2-oxoglutarate aldolase
VTPAEAAATELARSGVVAVLRAPGVGAAVAAAGALAAGGITAVEVTFTFDGAEEAIRRLRRIDELLVGAGSVVTPDQVAAAADAGARYVVSPHLAPAVIDAADALGVLAIPGAFTPTEIVAAAARSRLVKLFPASVGGPPMLRALREPLPELALLPTGGVTPENVHAWLEAGAVAVGAGGGLCPPEALAARDWRSIERRAAAYRGALDAARRRLTRAS